MKIKIHEQNKQKQNSIPVVSRVPSRTTDLSFRPNIKKLPCEIDADSSPRSSCWKSSPSKLGNPRCIYFYSTMNPRWFCSYQFRVSTVKPHSLPNELWFGYPSSRKIPEFWHCIRSWGVNQKYLAYCWGLEKTQRGGAKVKYDVDGVEPNMEVVFIVRMSSRYQLCCPVSWKGMARFLQVLKNVQSIRSSNRAEWN